MPLELLYYSTTFSFQFKELKKIISLLTLGQFGCILVATLSSAMHFSSIKQKEKIMSPNKGMASMSSTKGYTELGMKGSCAAIDATRIFGQKFGKREIIEFKKPKTRYAVTIGAISIACCKDVTLFATA